MKTFTKISLIATLALSACGDANLPVQKMDGATELNKPAVAHTATKIVARKGVNTPIDANCTAQSKDTQASFTAPGLLKLPVFQSSPGPDVIVTCMLEGETKSIILSSSIMGAKQTRPLTEATGVDTLVPDGNNFGGGTGGLLALGLGVNAASNGFYIYPDVAYIDFN